MPVLVQRATLIQLALIAGFGVLSHHAQRAVDEGRFGGGVDSRWLVLPDARTVRVAAMGFDILAAGLLWIRAGLTFSEVLDAQDDGGELEVGWLRATLEAVVELDPRWRTAYFYGGGFLRLCGDIEGSDKLYRGGMSAIPDDPFFPFSLAMNAYLYHDDVETAGELMSAAADLPGAPAWYRSAAAGFLHKRGQRAAALKYLEGQIEVETNPQALEILQARQRGIVHEQLAEVLSEARRRVEARQGRPLRDVAEVAEILKAHALPADPFGEGWILSPDGGIHSARMEAILSRKARNDERGLLLRRAGGEVWLKERSDG